MIRGGLHSELERNYAWVMARDVETRADYIATMQNRAGRIGSRALLSFAEAFPDFTGVLLDRSVEGTDYRYLGAGSKSSVITAGDIVEKIHRKSAFMSEKDRKKLAYSLSRQHDLLMDKMGDTVVPQSSFSSQIHPLSDRTRAVISTQKRIDFIPLEIFSGYTSRINEDELASVLTIHPQIKDDLGGFVFQGLRMYRDTGMIPDATGIHNVVIDTDSRVRLLGALPLDVKEQPEQVSRINQQLLHLHFALNEN